MRKAITAGSAKRVAAAVTAIFNSGDPATAEVMRVWFNRSFKGFSIEPLKDGERVTGYRLTSRYYAGDLSETTTKAPVRGPGPRRWPMWAERKATTSQRPSWQPSRNAHNPSRERQALRRAAFLLSGNPRRL